MFCKNCGREIGNNSIICEGCGSSIEPVQIGEKDWTTTLILSVFMGMFGVHRFYTGYTSIGIAQALTAGGCGIWTLVDIISLCINNYKDSDNRYLKNYIKSLGIGYLIISIIVTILFVLLLLLLILGGIASAKLTGVIGASIA